jgi:hypothetical protein
MFGDSTPTPPDVDAVDRRVLARHEANWTGRMRRDATAIDDLRVDFAAGRSPADGSHVAVGRFLSAAC